VFLRLLLLALCLACSGCESIRDILGIGSSSTLWLPAPGEHRRKYNSFDEYRGLAGLRVELTGAVERVFTAEDFPVEPFSVPDDGRVFVGVSLAGGPNIVGSIATGQVAWDLELNKLWTLRFDRAPWPPISYMPMPPGEPAVPCAWRGCREYWRFEIDASARNYEEEALWLALWGSTPCPEGHYCD